MEEEDPGRISFYRVAVKIDGVEARLYKANVKLRLCGQNIFPQCLRVIWVTDGFKDQTHKASSLPTDMRYRSHSLLRARHAPKKPLCSYVVETSRGVIVLGTTDSKDGFTLVTSRFDVCVGRQEASGTTIDGQRAVRIENWWYYRNFPPGWIDIPHLTPDATIGFITFEFRPLYGHENLSWREKWESSLSRKICLHNDWISFWWEGFSNISFPLSRVAGNPTAIQRTAAVAAGRFTHYPRPATTTPPSTTTGHHATLTPPEAEHNIDGVVTDETADDVLATTPGRTPEEAHGEEFSIPTDNSLTLVPVASKSYAEELLREASAVFIREKLRMLNNVDELWSYSP
ncbi:hypothetical protein TWF718_002704 [Orbilia javanica]|uniref:Uncharacterized protein n=1 Tax=Orbilia javanica TaxID=47235 RepID=A0AAN8MJC6_9PEZI